jgi:two-component system, cell cycle sensor histidine kinase and response regulator CckA
MVRYVRCVSVNRKQKSMTTTNELGGARKKTVLLVDDESAIVLLFEMELNRLGYYVMTAHSATEALLHSMEFHGTIDILVTDWKMPDMNGHSLAAKLLSQRPEMKVIVMSGYSDAFDDTDLFTKNKAVFLHKPFSPAALHDNIRKLLQPQDTLDSHAA